MYVCYFPQTFIPSPKTVFNFDFIPKIVCQETGRIVIPARPNMFPSPPPPVVLPPVVRSTPSPPLPVVSPLVVTPSPPLPVVSPLVVPLPPLPVVSPLPDDKLLSIPVAQKEPIPKIGTLPPVIPPPLLVVVPSPPPVVLPPVVVSPPAPPAPPAPALPASKPLPPTTRKQNIEKPPPDFVPLPPDHSHMICMGFCNKHPLLTQEVLQMMRTYQRWGDLLYKT